MCVQYSLVLRAETLLSSRDCWIRVLQLRHVYSFELEISEASCWPVDHYEA